MFSPADAAGPFRQGEIIASLVDYVFDPETEELAEYAYEYGVVLAQDCDLERFHAGLPAADAPVLVFPASDAEAGREAAGLNSKEWRVARGNNNPRYHVIERCPEEMEHGDGLPDLMIDFRRFFVLQHDQLRKQVGAGQAVRRTRLLEPYREHLQFRAMFYLGRVALDPPHNVP